MKRISTPDDEAKIRNAIIRVASERDLPMIEHVVRSAYKDYISRIGRPPAPMTDDYHRHVTAGNVWVVVMDSQIVGIIVLIAKSNYMLLDNVAVAPEEQRSGFGRRLMLFAEVRARQCGYREIQLYTNELMLENIAFYHKLGYREIDRCLDSGFKRVFMKKAL
jgi:N-acetylglutamate synthase-like GNAT family acetyltransferase